MSEERADGSSWLRAEWRRKADPEDRREGRAALMRRLFGEAAPEPTADDNPDDGPDAA